MTIFILNYTGNELGDREVVSLGEVKIQSCPLIILDRLSVIMCFFYRLHVAASTGGERSEESRDGPHQTEETSAKIHKAI